MPEETPNALDVHELLKRHPADVAEILAALEEEEAAELLRRLYLRRAAAAPLGEMDPEEAAKILAELNRDEAVKILSHMDPDDAVDLLAELPPETVQDILSRLEVRQAQELRELLVYPPDTAGGLMSTEVVALPPDMTVQQAIDYLRRVAEEVETVYYAYVVDKERRLVGVLSLRELVLARPDAPIHSLMQTEFVYLPVDMDVEEVARMFDKYNYMALPVLDKRGRLLGIVTVDDVLDVIREETTEDVLRLGGIPAGEDHPLDPPQISVRKRLPWLMALVMLNLTVSTLVRQFEATIAQIAFIAALMPLIADMSGNAASQALAVVIRGMAVGAVDWRNLGWLIWKELRVGLLAGLVLGAQIGLIGGLIWHRPLFGVVAGLALMGTTVGACLTGGTIPFLFKRVGVDPAMVSGPVATTIGDLIGIGLFLGLATVFLPYLA